MNNITFNCRFKDRIYNFYAKWENSNKITSIFSSNVDGVYNGQINLLGKQANNFVYCLKKIDLLNLGNKHQIKDSDEDCILTFNDEKGLRQNKWNMYTFPKDVDYLYTAIALCDNKFLNIFKKERFN